ncbi:addiction module toxin RelE [Candidatus Campbellbacteria bacterium]|nr:MAG: addiction module toxin RelE [Candidatus Campbellbacteria bacterium]
MNREIKKYKNYFDKFISKLEFNEAVKVLKALDILKFRQEFTLKHFVKKIKSVKGVYELRTQYGNNEFRIFYIYENDKIIVLFNGIKKKNQKLSKKELEKIKLIKKAYDKEK